MPTLIIVGDAASIRPPHVVEMYELLGCGQHHAGWDGSRMLATRLANHLAVLPGTTYYNSFQSPPLAPIILPFLNDPMPETR